MQHPGKAGPGSRSTPGRWPEASARALKEWEGQPHAARLSRDDSWQMMELKKIQVQSSMEINSDLSRDLDLHDHQQHNEACPWPRWTHTGPERLPLDVRGMPGCGGVAFVDARSKSGRSVISRYLIKNNN